MLKVPPVAVVLAGINGAGKTTSAKKLLANRLALLSFVNSDVIAKGINGCDPESVAMEAGTIMIDRMHKLADQKETSRSRLRWLAEYISRFCGNFTARDIASRFLIFWLPTPHHPYGEFAIGSPAVSTIFRKQRFGSGMVVA